MPFDGGSSLRFQVLDVLEKSRRYLADRNHWVKGAERSDDMVCILGAVKLYAEDYPEADRPRIVDRAMDTVGRVIASLYGIRSHAKRKGMNSTSRVTSFNDTREIPHCQVVIALDNAIENVIQQSDMIVAEVIPDAEVV